MKNIFLYIITFIISSSIYGIGYHRGFKSCRTKYQTTIESLKKDNDLWWKKLDKLRYKLDSIIFDMDTNQFENHSEIK